MNYFASHLFAQMLDDNPRSLTMTEAIHATEIPFQEMFRILHRGIECVSDLNRTNRTFGICLLTISFSLFFLIISLVYLNPDLYVAYCDNKDHKELNNVPQILYNDLDADLSVERYVSTVTVSDLIDSDSDSSFFPDVGDIEIIDEISDISDPPRLAEQESIELDSFNNADSAGKFPVLTILFYNVWVTNSIIILF